MAAPEILNSQQSTVFPQEIEVFLTLRVKVSDQEARDYFLNKDTGVAAIQLIADEFDNFEFLQSDEILSINNLTKIEVQQILAEEKSV